MSGFPSKAGRMTNTISAIYRYPVKGLSAEKLERVALLPGRCLPQDRRFAIALGSTVFDPENPLWLPKTRFVMLIRDESLALLQSGFDAETGVLTIAENGREVLSERLGSAAGCRAVAEFCAEFFGPAVDGPLRVVEAAGHAFADAPRRPNAATANMFPDHGSRNGDGCGDRPAAVSRERLFRRGSGVARAWWIGAEIGLGAARLRVVSAITRCAATEVNPLTAKRDLDIPAALDRNFGHIHMGIYAEVLSGGEIALGDELSTLTPTPDQAAGDI
jgi:uncharacterized protein YcbX